MPHAGTDASVFLCGHAIPSCRVATHTFTKCLVFDIFQVAKSRSHRQAVFLQRLIWGLLVPPFVQKITTLELCTSRLDSVSRINPEIVKRFDRRLHDL